VLLSAADLHGDRPAPGGNPVIYVWPAVLMPALVVIMAILLLSVWLRKQQVVLAAMGIQDSALILAIIGALTIMGLAALAAASLIALGISTVVRIILLRYMNYRCLPLCSPGVCSRSSGYPSLAGSPLAWRSLGVGQDENAR
jgi:putative membrane protein